MEQIKIKCIWIKKTNVCKIIKSENSNWYEMVRKKKYRNLKKLHIVGSDNNKKNSEEVEAASIQLYLYG